jgi:DNA-binding transcriptional LysR family regulator
MSALDNIDRHLRNLITIAESGSLSRAAEALDLTQSALSKRLTTLESFLGQPLFLRTGRGVELTKLGARLLATAKESYRSIDATLDAIREKEGITQGNLGLASAHTLSYYFTSDLVSRFIGRRSRVNVSLMGRSSPEVVELVESGKADIGLAYDSAAVSPLVRLIPLFDDEMCLVTKRIEGSRETIDLTEEPFRLIVFPPGYALRQMLERSAIKSEFVAEAETVDVMLRLIASGIGDGVLPCRMPDDVIDDHGLVKRPIRHPDLRRRVVAIVKADKPVTGLTKQLLEIATSMSP